MPSTSKSVLSSGNVDGDSDDGTTSSQNRHPFGIESLSSSTSSSSGQTAEAATTSADESFLAQSQVSVISMETSFTDLDLEGGNGDENAGTAAADSNGNHSNTTAVSPQSASTISVKSSWMSLMRESFLTITGSSSGSGTSQQQQDGEISSSSSTTSETQQDSSPNAPTDSSPITTPKSTETQERENSPSSETNSKDESSSLIPGKVSLELPPNYYMTNVSQTSFQDLPSVISRIHSVMNDAGTSTNNSNQYASVLSTPFEDDCLWIHDRITKHSDSLNSDSISATNKPAGQSSNIAEQKTNTEPFFINVFVEVPSSWIGIEEFVFTRYFQKKVSKSRKYFLFQDKYPAVVVQSADEDLTQEASQSPSSQSSSSHHKRKRSTILTISIQLARSVIVTFQARVRSSAEWDEMHAVVDSIRVKEDFPAVGHVQLNATINDSSGDSVTMSLPSPFCTTLEYNLPSSPKRYTPSLYSEDNRIFEAAAPLILNLQQLTQVYCGFALYCVKADDVRQFIEKYQHFHAPAPEKIDMNLRVKNMLCRFFQYEGDEHSFLDCIFEHPNHDNEIFIFSIYVHQFVFSHQRAQYIEEALKCLETLEFCRPAMMNVRSSFLYESNAYEFSMRFPSESLIMENPETFSLSDLGGDTPYSVGHILTVISQVVVYPKPNSKRCLIGGCKTRVTKCYREVPDEEDPNPEKLSEIMEQRLMQVYPSARVSSGHLRDECITRYMQLIHPNHFLIGTYVFYNAGEIYLFESELMEDSAKLRECVLDMHNSIRFKA